jgi:hypothetical protein
MSAGQTIILQGLESRKKADSLVNAAPYGSVMTIKPPTRTMDQNSKLWAMLSDVSRAKPEGREHTPDVWKHLFMSACGHEVQFLMGLDGNPFPAGFRSSRLSKEQMAELISFIDAWGSERGVVWSDEERN